MDDLTPNTEHSEAFEHKDLKLPSTFSPPMVSNLQHIYYLIMEDVLTYKPPPRSKMIFNLTKPQRISLRKLGDDESIVIKKADKGANIVIQDRKNYISECLRQLNDLRFYLKLGSDMNSKFRSRVECLVTEMLNTGQISEKTFKYLMGGGDRTPIFYTLPKVHKEYNVVPPGRPIVSSVNGPTERISQLFYIILQPYAQSGASFILDTGDFLNKIKNLDVTQNDWIFVIDVTSLYTNIPHHGGIRVVSEQIQDRKGFPSNENILKMLSLVLKCNCFRFYNEFFLQINGTAMGTRVAPTYAIMYMNWFEETFIYSYHKKPRIWFRFIHDVWGIFRGTEPELKTFIETHQDCTSQHKVHCGIFQGASGIFRCYHLYI